MKNRPFIFAQLENVDRNIRLTKQLAMSIACDHPYTDADDHIKNFRAIVEHMDHTATIVDSIREHLGPEEGPESLHTDEY